MGNRVAHDGRCTVLAGEASTSLTEPAGRTAPKSILKRESGMYVPAAWLYIYSMRTIRDKNV